MSLNLKPRSHPYLFFSAADLPALRARARRPLHDVCYRLLLETAARLLDEPLPGEPAIPDSPADENGFQQQLYVAGCALQHFGQVFAFAYALSRDSRCADRAREWAVTCAAWQAWSRTGADLPAAHYLLGTTLIYDWLGDYLSLAERQLLRGALVRQLAAFHRRWCSPARPPRPDSAAWVCLAAAGLGSLALLHEEEQAPSWAADWTRLFQSWLLPASFGSQGEFLSGGDWRAVYALRQGLLFLDALGRGGGPDLLLDPGLQAFPDFLRHNSEAGALVAPEADPSWTRFPSPSPLHHRYLLLRLAAASRSGTLFQLATRQGLEVPQGTPLEDFYRDLHQLPCQPGRWYTVSLSWDAAQGDCRLGIDRRHWDLVLAGDPALAHVDGMHLTGSGLALRHLGARAGQAPAAVPLEQQAELRLGAWTSPPPETPCLQVPELRVRFAAAAQGMVWFQLRQAGTQGEAAIRLLCGARPGPGLRIAPAPLPGGPGAEFLSLDSDGHTAPPGSWRGGQIWFDGPWEYLWCDPDRSGPPPAPLGARHFADAGLVFLRGQEGDPELRFCAGPEEGPANSFALRVAGEPLIGASSRSRAATWPLPWDPREPASAGSALRVLRGKESPDPPAGGRIGYFFTSPAFDAVAGEADQVYPRWRGFRRRLAYIKPDYFVLADDLTAAAEAGPGAGPLEWRLPASGELRLEAGWLRIQGRCRGLDLLPLHPAVPPGESAGSACLPLELRNGRASLLVLLVPRREADRPAFRAEGMAVRGGVGLRLARGSAVDLVLFGAPARDRLSAEGLRSDADLCCARRSGRSAPSLYALVQGTYLQARTELVRISQPADLCVRQTPARLSATVQAPAALELRLAMGGPPRAVRLDGEPLAADAFHYVNQGRRLVLALPAGVHQLEVVLR